MLGCAGGGHLFSPRGNRWESGLPAAVSGRERRLRHMTGTSGTGATDSRIRKREGSQARKTCRIQSAGASAVGRPGCLVGGGKVLVAAVARLRRYRSSYRGGFPAARGGGVDRGRHGSRADAMDRLASSHGGFERAVSYRPKSETESGGTDDEAIECTSRIDGAAQASVSSLLSAVIKRADGASALPFDAGGSGRADSEGGRPLVVR
jgi:hypothetical protein